MPLSLAIFIFFQTIYPMLVKGQNAEAKRNISSAAAASKVKVVVPEPEILDLKKVPNAKYYSYKANYSCAIPGKTHLIPSYFDSFEINNGTLCQVGDVCGQSKKECHGILPKKIQLAQDFESIEFDKMKYKKQATSIHLSTVM